MMIWKSGVVILVTLFSQQTRAQGTNGRANSCYQQGVDYRGNEVVLQGKGKGPPLFVLPKVTRTNEECQEKCLDDDQCTNWSRSKYNALCYLKTRKGSKHTDWQSAMMTSGPKRCGDCQKVNGNYCHEQGIAYVGNDLESADRTSLEECQCWCQDYKECDNWTWVEDYFAAGNHGCWLVSRIAKKLTMNKATSGKKKCLGPDSAAAGNKKECCGGDHTQDEAGFEYLEWPIYEYEGIKSVSQCRCNCEKKTECKAWSYKMTQYGVECYLYSAQANEMEKHENPNAVSGQKQGCSKEMPCCA